MKKRLLGLIAATMAAGCIAFGACGVMDSSSSGGADSSSVTTSSEQTSSSETSASPME